MQVDIKPKIVFYASSLLYGSLVLSFINFYFLFIKSNPSISSIYYLPLFILAAIPIYFVEKRKNWARLLVCFLIFFQALSMLVYILLFRLFNSPVVFLGVMTTSINLISAILLITSSESRKWFDTKNYFKSIWDELAGVLLRVYAFVASLLGAVWLLSLILELFFCNDPSVCHSLGGAFVHVFLSSLPLLGIGPGVFCLSLTLYRYQRFIWSIMVSILIPLFYIGAIIYNLR